MIETRGAFHAIHWPHFTLFPRKIQLERAFLEKNSKE